jgi:hypothetical protein
MEACAVAKKEEPSGNFLQGAGLPCMLVRRGFYCSYPRFLARIFGHQLSELMFDSDSRRKLELSSKMMRAHCLSCRNRIHAGNGVVSTSAFQKIVPSAP